MREGGKDALDNLVFLCSMHHAELDMKKGSEAILPEAVKTAREKLYHAIEQEPNLSPASRPRVFVVHGHDAAAKDEVVLFLGKIGLEPVVLSEEPTLGRTVLEKLESHADVQYALVLLSPDESWSDTRRINRGGSRARQNVIFELGYFIGRLGRNRVCALYKPPVELPSDYHGTLYVEMDAEGNWRRTVIRELQASGLAIMSK
jgi:predicted nucleotide-binding protein